MNRALRTALEQTLAATITRVQGIAGGDINDAHAVELSDGRKVFVKTHARAAPTMFSREAEGLSWLAEADAIRIPGVLAHSDPDGPGPHFLALEFIARGPRKRDFDVVLGRSLAALHRAGAPFFGLGRGNFIATLEQDNRRCADWSEFYATRRLLPQVRLAVERGHAPRSWLGRFDRLAEIMDDLVGPPEPPARLHGDLWSGNVHSDESGTPCLIDPAVYGGHREIDLAMLALFGGLSQRLLDAYHEVHPLAAGRGAREPLYQLYPLLVHVNLFGGGYVNSVESALRRYL